MNPIYAIAALLAAITACSDVPDSPTWTEDVRPILVANCTRCHTPPQIGGAPEHFRLDRYDDSDGPDEDSLDDVGGAMVFANQIEEEVAAKQMPPRYPLSDRQIETLVRWNEDGAPRGQPRPDNSLPTIDLTEDLQVEANRVILDYEIGDLDRDLVTGDLRAQGPGGEEALVVSNMLFSGRHRLVWDTRQITPGSYDLFAELYDGQEMTAVDIATVEVQP